MSLVGQFWCWLTCGHDYVLQFDPGRLFQVCTTCGYESRGWHWRVRKEG